MAFTAIPNSSIDADSPLDTTLMTYLRDNDDYLKGLFNSSTGHTHSGGGDSGAPIVVPDGSITTAKLADGSVTNAKLNGGVCPLNIPLVNSNSPSWQTVFTTYMYFPINCTSLAITTRMKTSQSGVTAQGRIKIGGSYSNETGETGIVFADVNFVITPSGVDKVGMVAVEVQLKSTSATAYLHKSRESTDDPNKSWAEASYFYV